MRPVAIAISFLTPLILAPRLLLYYDITPKVALLFLAAAAVLLFLSVEAFRSQGLDSLRAFAGTRPGFWCLAAAGVSILTAGGATLLSAHPALAWYGSNWRRYGALTEIAVILGAVGIAVYAAGSRGRVFLLLRSISAAGCIASAYGIAQYLGWDPLLTPSGYHAGEGIYTIVRPPGPLGHSDYFSAFLLWPLFTGVGLWKYDRRPVWRWTGAGAGVLGSAAIILSGSRGAWLGLLVGASVLVWLLRPAARTISVVAATAAVCLALFYFSPLGLLLRARIHWIGEDREGGARLLLWRDSTAMASARPWAGFGPDTFVAEFPRFQSLELAQAYPDFYHESPHNIFLDALTSQGAPGALALALLSAVAIAAGWKSRKQSPELAVALLPAFIAVLAAQQFAVFIAPTAFYFYLGAGLLAGADAASSPPRRPVASLRWAVAALGIAGAVFFGLAAYRLVAEDAALAAVQRRLDQGDDSGAAAAYREALSLPAEGVSADLYFSRRWANVAAKSSGFARVYYSQLAAGSASRAARSPEQRQNACYNLAMLAAYAGNPAVVERDLRDAIAAAPNWYKPHWTLARLLATEGRTAEASSEARLTLELDGNKDAEVSAGIRQILRSESRTR